MSSPGETAAGEFDASAPLPVISREVTQEVIDSYAQASGDHNPIHVDPDYARNGPFGKTIAHGLMTLAYVSQMLNRWTGGRFDACGEIEIAFVAPVFAGDKVEVTGEVEEICDRAGRPVAKVRLVCKAADRQILSGHAYQPIEAEK